jgi:hypothetical protein
MGLNILRYLSFEINNTCNMAELHKGQCPINHPERYKFSTSKKSITTSDVMMVWGWARKHGFRGLVQFHMYNEPLLVLPQMSDLIRRMRTIDPRQPFQLTTNFHTTPKGFDIINISDYAGGVQLDQRILTNEREGKSYSEMPKKGLCGRGRGWEVIIDYFGNWCLCCNDWRCEESVGNIHNTPYDVLLERWEEKRMKICWTNQQEYDALPRMCRACMDKNPTLMKREGL